MLVSPVFIPLTPVFILAQKPGVHFQPHDERYPGGTWCAGLTSPIASPQRSRNSLLQQKGEKHDL